jgi:hypothetical protein
VKRATLNADQKIETRKRFKMKTFKTLLITGVLMGLAVGCASTKSKEDMLSAAGFNRVPANTPQRQAHLNSLPADKITPVVRDGITYYTFPDPKQGVLYVGQEPQYQQYQRLRQQQQMEDEQLEAAQLNDQAWGAWGPWGGPGWAWR